MLPGRRHNRIIDLFHHRNQRRRRIMAGVGGI